MGKYDFRPGLENGTRVARVSPWSWIAAVAAALLVTSEKARASVIRVVRGRAQGAPQELNTAEGRQAMARTLIAETSGLEKYPDSELEAIGFVGVNRAVDSGRSIVEVMGPDARSNQGVWNNSQAFRSRWNDAPTFPKWPRAERIARRVLSGEIADPIDGRTLFAHISGLPRPVNGSCGPRRYLSKDSRGRDRCAPNWLKNDPVTIGAATFARGDRS